VNFFSIWPKKANIMRIKIISHTKKNHHHKKSKIKMMQSETQLLPELGSIYHDKETFEVYRVHRIVFNTETNERMVLFQEMEQSKQNPDHLWYVKSLSVFMKKMKYNGRNYDRFQTITKSSDYTWRDTFQIAWNFISNRAKEQKQTDETELDV
jgi:hypothetical protein